MASGPTLPPQAYTREMLTAAFTWLQTQPDSVRKIATTPDALVGLYVRAQRWGNSTLETDAPVSSQSFMSDLKHLAEDMKQFEDPREKLRPSPPPANTSSYEPHNNSEGKARDSVVGAPSLNLRSIQMVQEVKNHLNLSSDAEAMNMMVALAYKNLKNLLV